MTALFRDSGPILFEGRVFHNRASQDALLGELLSSGFLWFWESARGPNDNTYNNPNLPPVRHLTQLTKDNLTSLLDDLREQNTDGYGRLVVITGVASDKAESLFNLETYNLAQKEFAAHSEGPIRTVIFVEPDSLYEYVFVPRKPPEPVRKLLKTWGISKITAYKTRQYDLYRNQLVSSLGYDAQQ